MGNLEDMGRRSLEVAASIPAVSGLDRYTAGIRPHDTGHEMTFFFLCVSILIGSLSCMLAVEAISSLIAFEGQFVIVRRSCTWNVL